MNTLVKEIAKYEGKKSQARIGDLREIIKLVNVLDIVLTGEKHEKIANEFRIARDKINLRAAKLSMKGMTEEQIIKKIMGLK